MSGDAHHEDEVRTFPFSNPIARLRRPGILAKLRQKVADHVPVRYEDESGFHFGMDEASFCAMPDSDAEVARF
jgi:hypothetical protein